MGITGVAVIFFGIKLFVLIHRQIDSDDLRNFKFVTNEITN